MKKYREIYNPLVEQKLNKRVPAILFLISAIVFIVSIALIVFSISELARAISYGA